MIKRLCTRVCLRTEMDALASMGGLKTQRTARVNDEREQRNLRG